MEEDLPRTTAGTSSSSSVVEEEEGKKGKKRPHEPEEEGVKEKREAATETEEAEGEMIANKKKTKKGPPPAAGEEKAEAEAGEGNPLLRLRFSADPSVLDNAPRTQCERCRGMFKFFCYDCARPVGHTTDGVPPVPLPVPCDILYHPTEKRSKSTALHAKVLSPDNVSVYTFPDLPDYNPDEVFLLYPSKDAKPIEEIDVSKMKKLVVIDSTWQKSKSILRDERVSKLPCVKIDSQKTLFWRYQTVGDSCLATIEAIYYFYREYHQKQIGPYNGEYDDLLFFYTYMYNLIQQTYKQQNKKFRHIEGWLKDSKPQD